MARIYKENEIKLIKEGGKRLAQIIKKLTLEVREGKSAKEVEQTSRELYKKAGGSPSFLNYRGFPKAICVSVNEEVVHTVPGNRKFKKGDVVSIDAGLKYKGFHTDMAVTIPVGQISKEKEEFLKTCKKALYDTIKIIKPGVSLGIIGYNIENIVKKKGFSVIKELTGHGIGRQLHEPPSILNYGKKGKGETLKKGMVMAIEPIISMGGSEITNIDKYWKIVTRDKSLSCHFEHTLSITDKGALILTK